MRTLMIILRDNAIATNPTIHADYPNSGRMAYSVYAHVLEIKDPPKEGEFFKLPLYNKYICLKNAPQDEIPEGFDALIVVSKAKD
jgi:hypothetical protein